MVIEAERYDQQIGRGGKSWNLTTATPGYVGTGAMISSPNTGVQVDTNYTTTVAEMRYRIRFNTPGTYHVWLRAHADHAQDNAVHVGLNGQALTTSDRMTLNKFGSWQWTKDTMDGSQVATINIPSAGVYTLNIWMREDGMRLDRLLLTTNASFIPSGTGPAQSLFATSVQPLSEPLMFSFGGETATASNQQKRPQPALLFESYAIKSIEAAAWSRHRSLFPALVGAKS